MIPMDRARANRHLSVNIKEALKGRSFTDLKDDEKLMLAYKHLEELRQLNGGYIASDYCGDKGGDRYNVFWLRDIMYATYANEYVGAYDKLIESYRLIIRIFQKYRQKITNGARKRTYLGSCADEVIHARVHPVTLEEITSEWGHHQLDIFGLFLYKTGDLIKKGHNVISTDQAETQILLRDIVLYLTTVRWHSDPDFGVWEEGPELHSSSIGAVLAGLTMWHDDGYYHYKYKARIPIHQYMPVPQEFIERGRSALERLLPSESASRPVDLAQLSLVWPYYIINDSQAVQIISNVEKRLVRRHGVIRYPGDLYYNADRTSPAGNEAEWPLGFAWLSIAYSQLAIKALRLGEIFSPPVEYIEKSEHYLRRLESVMTPEGQVPELYTAGRPNYNVPLAWAQSFYVVARQNLNRLHEKLNLR
ncbi:MAG: glycoside hydrolase family 15 protein [Thermodesulfobacteriota bacterium]|nr:MAG: glycoside hydrolase family 15 protein [Thermodesulfobacteriota bacterium]